MIRVDNLRGTTCVACDTCRRECPESRTPGIDGGEVIGWYGGLAIAGAKLANWERSYRGRLAVTTCPQCQKRKAPDANG